MLIAILQLTDTHKGEQEQGGRRAIGLLILRPPIGERIFPPHIVMMALNVEGTPKLVKAPSFFLQKS